MSPAILLPDISRISDAELVSQYGSARRTVLRPLGRFPVRGRGKGPAGTGPSADEVFAPDFANVVLLAGFEGADGQTDYADETGLYTRTGAITFAGNAQLDTADKQFGTASLLLDGTGDFLTLPDSAEWTPGAGEEFTIEAWVKPATAVGSFEMIAAHYESTGDQRSWSFYRDSAGKLAFAKYPGTTTATYVLTGDIVLAQNTWAHVMVSRDGAGIVRLFVDGEVQTSTQEDTAAFFNAGEVLEIGIRDDSLLPWNGWIDELRILRRKAAQTDTFTVPASAYTRGVSDPNWPFTVLLCSFDGEDAATAFVNEAPMKFSANGSAVLDDSSAPTFNTTSLELSADGLDDDFMTFTDQENHRVSEAGDMVIEAWINPVDNSDVRTIMAKRPTSTAHEYHFVITATDLVQFLAFANGTAVATVTATAAVTHGAWQHVAVMRKDGTWYLFLDGELQDSVAESSAPTAGTPVATYIGRSFNNDSRDFAGRIAEIRISREAFYPTENFIPPAAAFARS